MVEACELLRVVAVVEAVGSGCRWGGCVGVNRDLEVGRPPVVHDAYSPEAMSGVTPTAEDDVAI